jgi:cyclophilin family peptidyl-prolyl cis-trans isomerase
MALLDGLEGRTEPAVRDAVAKVLGWGRLATGTPEAPPDPYVVAAAVSLAGKNHLHDLLDDVQPGGSHVVASSLADALLELWKDESAGEERRGALLARLRDLAATSPWAIVRQTARQALRTAGVEGVPSQDPRQENDWTGLPRPKGPVLGVDLTGPTPWLHEAEILRLADAIARERPRIAFRTTQGDFVVAVDAEAAPVHSAALVLAVAAKVYDGTRWHRVVPSFVIQGGDPRGHGGGDAGYPLPDEITHLRYVRGALGMPKDVIRDTGGSQLFFMHSPYRPLDGRYSCYGRVVSGMETVDAIRVGDRILEARIVR